MTSTFDNSASRIASTCLSANDKPVSIGCNLIQWARGEAMNTMTSAASSAASSRPIGKP
jgi:hypothetical protein